MAMPESPEHAILFLAECWSELRCSKSCRDAARGQFGEIALSSPEFTFSHSSYYAAEMGSPLVKQFHFCAGLFDVADAPSTKRRAMRIEAESAQGSSRILNIDPGYLTLAKLVLTTSKNYDHRLRIGRGVFGDVQLRYRKGIFVANPWTYPDYRESAHLQFFAEGRRYLQELIDNHEAQL